MLAMESTVSSYKSSAYIKMSAKVHKVSQEKFGEQVFLSSSVKIYRYTLLKEKENSSINISRRYYEFREINFTYVKARTTSVAANICNPFPRETWILNIG